MTSVASLVVSLLSRLLAALAFLHLALLGSLVVFILGGAVRSKRAEGQRKRQLRDRSSGNSVPAPQDGNLPEEGQQELATSPWHESNTYLNDVSRHNAAGEAESLQPTHASTQHSGQRSDVTAAAVAAEVELHSLLRSSTSEGSRCLCDETLFLGKSGVLVTDVREDDVRHSNDKTSAAAASTLGADASLPVAAYSRERLLITDRRGSTDLINHCDCVAPFAQPKLLLSPHMPNFNAREDCKAVCLALLGASKKPPIARTTSAPEEEGETSDESNEEARSASTTLRDSFYKFSTTLLSDDLAQLSLPAATGEKDRLVLYNRTHKLSTR